MGYHDVAQVCLNGHSINDSTMRSPQFNKDFCDKCGAPTITKCPVCNMSIQGYYHVEDVFDVGFEYHTPAFCQRCGNPFPWTQAGLEAAKELAELELSEEDSNVFEQSVVELVKDTPRTTIAAARMRKIFAKAGPAFGDAVREILVDIVSETAKKAIWG